MVTGKHETGGGGGGGGSSTGLCFIPASVHNIFSNFFCCCKNHAYKKICYFRISKRSSNTGGTIFSLCPFVRYRSIIYFYFMVGVL